MTKPRKKRTPKKDKEEIIKPKPKDVKDEGLKVVRKGFELGYQTADFIFDLIDLFSK
jgi:hypothetical protein